MKQPKLLLGTQVVVHSYIKIDFLDTRWVEQLVELSMKHTNNACSSYPSVPPYDFALDVLTMRNVSSSMSLTNSECV